MRVPGLGQSLFAVSFAVLGAACIAFRDIALVWQLPRGGTMQSGWLSVLSGAALFAAGIALLAPRTAKGSALALGAFLLVRMVMLKLPAVAGHPLVEATWEDLSENLAQFAGAWTMVSLLSRDGGTFARARRAGRILFALALPAIGLSHFLYLGQTASLIPAWLPWHVPLAFLTGLAHIAAGAGILFGMRLAATLEAAMVSLFTLLVWVPMVAGAPSSPADWSEICVSAAISGAAWLVARSFGAERESLAGQVML